MPYSAPLPVPTMMATGVARPRAQGQEMTSTATAEVRACSTLWPVAQPDHGGDQGDAHDHRNEDSGHFVGQLGNGSLGRGSLIHQPDHLGQGGVLAHPGGPEGEEHPTC